MSAADEPAGDEPAGQHVEQTAPPRVGPVIWAGLAIVGTSAAILSFAALSDLAYRVGIIGQVGPLYLAWLFPLGIDVFAGIATVIWLRRRASDEVVRVARWSAWAAIGSTVVGNAYHGFLADSGAEAPWLAVVVVSAVPAVALGALVHLAVLVGRDPAEGSPEGVSHERTGSQTPGDQGELSDDQLAERMLVWAVRDGDVPSRERIRVRYGVGSKRADRARTAALDGLTRWDPDATTEAAT